jgi:hypothetical protein
VHPLFVIKGDSSPFSVIIYRLVWFYQLVSELFLGSVGGHHDECRSSSEFNKNDEYFLMNC